MYQLTKEDIKRLKTADRIYFDFTPEKESLIGVVKKLNDEWDMERKEVIPVSSIITGASTSEIERCFFYLHTPQMSNSWKTIVNLLKPKDEIELQWCKGYGDCDLLRRAPSPITVDYLYFHVNRENGQGLNKRKYTFFLDYQLSKLDRLAAMIRLK